MKKGHENLVLFLAVVAIVTLAIAIIATQNMPVESAGLAKKTVDTTPTVTTTTQATLTSYIPDPPVTGAIFTTTPDGTIVNENVRYGNKSEVYLDGGPPPNAPAKAAGLKEGLYVFQITDPSGKYLLSEDPSKCRIINVSSDGVIIGLVNVSDLTELNLTDLYEPATKSKGKGPQKQATLIPCHVQDEPDGVAGPSEKHDTNHDVDYWDDKSAIVVQMMPFLDTPNPGGVYKAWVTPLQSYLDKTGDLNHTPSKMVKGKGFEKDPGFGPSRSDVKTDNFKVIKKDKKPSPLIFVKKFHDLDADGIWDGNEPEIGVDQCVELDGTLDPDCNTGGGWPVNITEPAPSSVTSTKYTPVEYLAALTGDYIVKEDMLSGWAQSALYLDDVQQPVSQQITVTVVNEYDENHTVIFGDYMPVSINGTKWIDMNGNGQYDGSSEDCANANPVNVPGCSGVTINLDGIDGMGTIVDLSTVTDANGYYEFTNLKPGTYSITVSEPNGFFCSFPSTDPTLCKYTNIVLQSDDVSENNDFGDFSKAEIKGIKYDDKNGNGQWDSGEMGVPGVTINLSGTDGMLNPVELSTTTDSNGIFSFQDLWPGTYTVIEEVPEDRIASTPTSSGPHVLTSDNITDLGHVFGNYIPAEKHGLKFIDLDADGVYEPPEENCANVDSAHELGCEGVTVHLDGLDGKGNPVHETTDTDENGAYSFIGLSPGEYTVTVDDPAGFYCSYPASCEWDVTLESDENDTDNNFGDFLPVNVSAHKFFDFDRNGIQDGYEPNMSDVLICLNYSNGTPVTHDIDGASIPGVDSNGCIYTDADGNAEWNNLMPGSYILTVYEPEGMCGTTLTQKSFTVQSGEEYSFSFGNYGMCNGLTPGFWLNWDNHYTQSQFLDLLEGTIAEGNVSLAEYYLDPTPDDLGDLPGDIKGCSDFESTVHCMERFLLANQLTLNLKLFPTYPQKGGSMFDECLVQGNESLGTLGDAIDLALEIHDASGSGYTKDEILDVKNILAAFAEQKNQPDYCNS
jgi:hypothetical protein